MKPASFLKRMLPELRAWRHDFHQYPEIAFEELRTSKIIAEKLDSFGLDKVVRNVGKTGVVGTIAGTAPNRNNKRKVGLRADIDALPMVEEGNIPHRSTIPGRFHGCGHDGHTTMLLVSENMLCASKGVPDNFELLLLGSCGIPSSKSPPVFGNCALHISTCRRRVRRGEGND